MSPPFGVLKMLVALYRLEPASIAMRLSEAAAVHPAGLLQSRIARIGPVAILSTTKLSRVGNPSPTPLPPLPVSADFEVGSFSC
jgi:hypothetical protein